MCGPVSSIYYLSISICIFILSRMIFEEARWVYTFLFCGNLLLFLSYFFYGLGLIGSLGLGGDYAVV